MKNVLLCTLLILTGCASGSHVITGSARPMTSPAAVKIYTEKPANAEVIGSVTCNNPNGFSHSFSSKDVSVLKEEAAKMGANGLIVGQSDLHPGRFETSGLAIYVPPSSP